MDFRLFDKVCLFDLILYVPSSDLILVFDMLDMSVWVFIRGIFMYPISIKILLAIP